MARVLLFGRLRDIAGWRERSFGPAGRLSAIKALIRLEDAGLADAIEGPGVQAAVDKALVRGDVDLGPDAEVAFLPAMSGG